MLGNITPKSYDPIIQHLEDAADGAHTYGAAVGLAQLLADDDDRWYAFGFEKPSDPHTPETPANLTAVAGAAGSRTVIADWDNARRADNYRLCAALKTDGTVVVLTVTARNAAGESPASDPVEIAVP